MSKSRRNAAILATRPSVAQPSAMTDRPKDRPKDRPEDQQKQRRERRLSAALRDNLKRRKAQAKGRKGGQGVERAPAGPSTETHDSAGFGEDKRNS
jgi:hypothetical protein